MSNANDTAFPSTQFYDEKPMGCTDGLTKREYFAAMAMQGLAAAESVGERYTPEGSADRAVKFADALLAELAKEQP